MIKIIDYQEQLLLTKTKQNKIAKKPVFTSLSGCDSIIFIPYVSRICNLTKLKRNMLKNKTNMSKFNKVISKFDTTLTNQFFVFTEATMLTQSVCNYTHAVKSCSRLSFKYGEKNDVRM